MKKMMLIMMVCISVSAMALDQICTRSSVEGVNQWIRANEGKVIVKRIVPFLTGTTRFASTEFMIHFEVSN